MGVAAEKKKNKKNEKDSGLRPVVRKEKVAEAQSDDEECLSGGASPSGSDPDSDSDYLVSSACLPGRRLLDS